jgi:hypothetical protein
MATQKEQQNSDTKGPGCKGAQVTILHLEGEIPANLKEKAEKAGHTGIHKPFARPKAPH